MTELTLDSKILTANNGEVHIREVVETLREEMPIEFPVANSTPFLLKVFGFKDSDGYMTIDGEKLKLRYDQLVDEMYENGLIARTTPEGSNTHFYSINKNGNV